jgi:hypothetical protein
MRIIYTGPFPELDAEGFIIKRDVPIELPEKLALYFLENRPTEFHKAPTVKA